MDDKRLFFQLNRAQHLLYTYVEQESRKLLGITPVQLGAIFFLLKNDGCLQRELAQGLHLNKPAVTGLVGRMEKAGLVTREDDARDARAARIFLTGGAREIAGKAFPLVAQLNEFMSRGFSEEEMRVVRRFVNSLTAALSGEKKP